MRNRIIFLLIISLAQELKAQKEIVQEQKLFMGYFNQSRITEKFGIWADLHYRRTDQFVHRSLQAIIRSGIICYFSPRLNLTAGYALARNFPQGSLAGTQIEHRPWQQLMLKQDLGFVQTSQWLRLEQRFIQKREKEILTNAFSLVHRIRYRYLLLIPFQGSGIRPGDFFGVVNDEVFFNLGKNITYNVFDQNRFFVGIGYQFTKNKSLQVGYMNIFLQQERGDRFTNSHCIRIFFYHNINFRNTETNGDTK